MISVKILSIRPEIHGQLHTRNFFHPAEKLAAALVDAGVNPGDIVAAQIPKSAEVLDCDSSNYLTL